MSTMIARVAEAMLADLQNRGPDAQHGAIITASPPGREIAVRGHVSLDALAGVAIAAMRREMHLCIAANSGDPAAALEAWCARTDEALR